MFDRSPVGLNHWLGLRFRCMLGRHIFARMGAGVKIYHGVDLTYGYNLSIGDGVTIRQRALLNDRGGITIGNNAVIGSFSRIFSTPTSRRTTTRSGCSPRSIGAGAHIATHAIVLAGQNMSRPANPSASSPTIASEARLLRRAHAAMHHKTRHVTCNSCRCASR